MVSLTCQGGGYTLVIVANYRRKVVVLPKGAHIGMAEPFDGDIVTPGQTNRAHPTVAFVGTPESISGTEARASSTRKPVLLPHKKTQPLRRRTHPGNRILRWRIQRRTSHTSPAR